MFGREALMGARQTAIAVPLVRVDERPARLKVLAHVMAMGRRGVTGIVTGKRTAPRTAIAAGTRGLPARIACGGW